MPAPDPEVAPGRAITGLAAFLDSGIDRAQIDPIVVDVLAGTVTIDPQPSSVEVDWGDGNEPQEYEGDARPWPDGDVTHAYETRDVVTVRVLQRWDAHWSYDGLLGARLEVDLQAELDRQAACLGIQHDIDVPVERQVELGFHDRGHIGHELRVWIALPPATQHGFRFDAAVEVLGEANLGDTARERHLDVTVDVTRWVGAGGRSARDRAVGM
jgi:hypothetical protein